MSFSLKLLGGAALEGGSGPLSGPAVQRHRLAMLALLALSRPRGQSRDKLMATLWPERDSERARALLNQAVHALRRALAADAILSTGDDLQLNPAVVACDVADYEAARDAGELERAVTLYAGPFLDGFFLDNAPEFERWAGRERDRLSASHAVVLERLAEAAEQAGDRERAVRWWRTRAVHDPYDSHAALRLMQALERAGNRAGALQHALAHQQLLRAELEIEPAPEVLALAERLRHEAPVATTPRHVGAVVAAAPADAPRAQPGGDLTAQPAPMSAPLGPPGPAIGRRWARWGPVALLAGVGVVAGTILLSGRGKAGAVAGSATVDEIAQAVARELSRRERGDSTSLPPPLRTASIPAYELYLRGNDPRLLRSDSTARLGLDYFKRAVVLDSNYAAAWAGVARMTYRTGGSPAEAEAAARKAIALDDSLAEAHGIIGLFRSLSNDFDAAEQYLTQAVALDPGRGLLREWLASFYLLTGRNEEALAEAERALALDPLSPSATAEVARALLANDRCDEALAKLETIATLDPPLLRTPSIAAHCYLRKHMWKEAEAILQPAVARNEGWAVAWHGYLLAKSGRREEALAIQSRLLEREGSGDLEAYYLAFVPTGLGEVDEAIRWLERFAEHGTLSLFAPGRHIPILDPPFDDLRRDPRFPVLRQRLLAQKR